MAGYFDGEGCVGIYDGRLVLQVAGLEIEPIRAFFERYGGALNHRSARTSSPRAMWQWACSGAEAKVCLSELLPLLRVKKAQAFEALKVPMTLWGKRVVYADREYNLVLASRLKEMKASAGGL